MVGPSGAGKSTLVDLIPRFYDVTDGAINIDGKNIKDVKLDSLRSLMGIVTQETFLFDDSVKANIAYGLDSVSDDIIKKLQLRLMQMNLLKNCLKDMIQLLEKEVSSCLEANAKELQLHAPL